MGRRQQMTKGVYALSVKSDSGRLSGCMCLFHWPSLSHDYKENWKIVFPLGIQVPVSNIMEKIGGIFGDNEQFLLTGKQLVPDSRKDSMRRVGTSRSWEVGRNLVMLS